MDNKTSHRSTLRVIEILNLVSKNYEGFRFNDICKILDCPKSSIFPIIHTLLEYNFLSLDEKTSKYTIGIACYSFGDAYMQNSDILEIIYLEMKKIVSICKETCLCASLCEGNTVYLKKVHPPEMITMKAKVGITLPAYSTGLGKSLLIDYSYEKLLETYPGSLKKLTTNTIADLEVLYKQLQEFTHEQVTYEYEESTYGMCCVAVPIRINNIVEFAISVVTPVFRYENQKKDLIKQLLLNAKTEIEKKAT